MPSYTPQEWVTLLHERLRRQASVAARWSAYYEGRQPLSYMAPELVKELGDRIRPVVLNWPRLVVDSLEERLDVEGFRYGTDAAADARLWEWWQANDMDEQSQQGHVEALAAGQSFVIVGASDDDAGAPVITVESAEQVTADIDPRTREVRAALKCWSDPVEERDYATLYLPDQTVWLSRPRTATDPTSITATVAGGRWEVTRVDEHRLGEVPVVPLVNRPRLLSPLGVSELVDVVPLSDAACKVATDMMVSAEYHAMPRRWVVGMGPDDFTDAEGRPVSEWSKVAGRIWATALQPSEVAMGQFAEADLSNFHNTINALAALVASVAGLPSDFLGLTTQNPPSAEARLAGMERLVKRAERRQRAFGGTWETVMRRCLLVMDGEAPPESRGLATVWRDASTPTVAAKADAAVKLFGAGITTRRQAREDVGYSASQIARMEVEDDNAVSRVLAGDLSSLMGPKPTPAAPDAVTG